MNPVSILPAYSAGCAPLVTRAARSRLRHAFQHFRTPSVPSIVVRFASHPAREDDAVFRRKSFTCVQRPLRSDAFASVATPRAFQLEMPCLSPPQDLTSPVAHMA